MATANAVSISDTIDHQQRQQQAFPANDTAVSFVITGFGPFRGVTDNPTTTIVKALPSYLSGRTADNDTPAVGGGGVTSSPAGAGEAPPPPPPPDNDLASNTTTVVFETSAQDVRSAVDALFDEIEKAAETATTEEEEASPERPTTRHVVLLHLGVNYKGKCFQIERCAYNDASFRVPDERGYQPKGECVLVGDNGERLNGDAAVADRGTNHAIGGSSKVVDSEGVSGETRGTDGSNSGGVTTDGSGGDIRSSSSGTAALVLPPHGHCLSTTLRVHGLVRYMSEDCGFGSKEVKPSSDPGRFVCNYAYCYSLHRSGAFNETTTASSAAGAAAAAAAADDATTTVHSLFLHVPPFKVIPFERQMEFVVGLMGGIREQLLKKKKK